MRTRFSLLSFALVLISSATSSAQDFTTPRARFDIHGNIALTGNAALTCSTTTGTGAATCSTNRTNRGLNGIDNNFNMVPIDEDQNNAVTGAATTSQSSGAILSMPTGSLVRRAYLYWMCLSTAATRNTISFQTPTGGGYSTKTADFLYTATSNSYIGVEDVTADVQAGGTGMYWVGNMQCESSATNKWGGWSMVVFFENSTEPLRNLVVWDGMREYGSTAITINPSGFVTPYLSSVDTDIGIFLGDGDLNQTDYVRLRTDAGILSPLYTALADPVSNRTDDVGNSTISVPSYVPAFSRIPSYANTLGFDIDVIRVSDVLARGSQAANIQLQGSSSDFIWTGAVTFATNIYAPDIGSTKTAVDVNGAPLLPGDILEYTIPFRNNGLDAATNVVFTDVLPQYTTLTNEANAIRYNGGNRTASGADSDGASYNAGTNTVTIDVSSIEGNFNPNNSATIILRVQLASAIPSGTTLSNQGRFAYNGLTLGTSQGYSNNTDGSTVSNGADPTNTPVTTPPRLTFVETVALTGDVDGQGDFDPGDTVTFTATLTNTGGDTTTGLVLSDTFDTNSFELVSVAASTGTQVGTLPGSPAFSVASLAAGQSVVITLVARIARPLPVGVTSATDQWSATVTNPNTAAILSDDPSLPGAQDPTRVAPFASVCDCFVGNVCYAAGAADPSNSCGSCQPVVSRTAFSSIADDSVCSVSGNAGSCHAGSCCTTCWNGSACVAGPRTCGSVCGDGQRIGLEECDDGGVANGDGCSASCGVEPGYSCVGSLPNVCVANVAILVPVAGSETSDTTPGISGTAPAGATVTVSEGARNLCVALANASGAWSCDSLSLSPGGHTIVATTSGPGGDQVGRSASRSFTVIPPCGDGIVAAGEECDDDGMAGGDGCSATCTVESGYSCSGTPSSCTANVAILVPTAGSETSDTTPGISGTAPASATVTVSEGAQVLCTATANASGAWSCDSSVLTLGGHTIVATTSGPGANQVGLSTSVTFTVILPCGDGIVATGEECDDDGTTSGDGCSATCTVESGYSCSGAPSTCTANVAILVPAAGSETSDTTPGISGTAPASATVTVSEGAQPLCVATANASGAWSCDSTTLTLGGHTIVATTAGPGANQVGLSTSVAFTVIAPCGDGLVAVDEECDDDGTTSGDGCSATCTVESGYSCSGAPSTCTANVAILVPAAGSETSDTTPGISGTAPAGATVTVSEGAQPLCVATANASGAWSCDSTTLTLGGHTIVATTAGPGANQVGLSTSVAFTVIAPCGDGLVAVDEECDDDGTTSGDGCSATCTVESGYSCSGTPSSCTANVAILVPTAGAETSDTTPGISGTAPASATVTVSEGGQVLCVATANASGAWSCDSTTLTLGGHTIVATTSGPGANQVGLSTSVAFTVIAPCGDGLVAVDEECDDDGTTSGDGCSATCTVEPGSSCTGTPSTCTATTIAITVPANASQTLDTTPDIEGTAAAGSTVSVYEGSTLLCVTTADTAGAWSCTSATLAIGSHTVRATSTGPTASDRGLSTDTVFEVVEPDLTARPSILSPADGGTVTSARPSVLGRGEPGASITVLEGTTTICTATVDAAGAWSCTPLADLSIGSHVFVAHQTKGTSMLESLDVTFEYDPGSLASPTLVSPAPDSTIAQTSPTLSGTAEPGSTVSVFEDGIEVCTATTSASGVWSCVPTTPFTEGDHVLELQSELGSRTSMGGPDTITVDLTAPTITIALPLDGAILANPMPTVSGTTEPFANVSVFEGPMLVCSATADSTGNWACAPTSALLDGSHSLIAVAADRVGNTSAPDTVAFVVDTTGPAAPVIVAPSAGAVLADTTPTISGTSEPNATIVVTEGTTTLCTTVADASGSWSCEPTVALSYAAHTITATASDALGNVGGSATRSFAIAAGVVSTPGLTSPLVPVADSTPVLVGTADPGSTVTVRDASSTVACTAVADASGVWTCTPSSPLVEGPNALTMTATDGVATSTPGTATVTVDTTAPAAPTIEQPGTGPIRTTRPTIGGIAEPGSTVTVTGPSGTICTAVTTVSGTWSCVPTSPLPEGPTNVSATATDSVGNASTPTTVTITVDTTAPVVVITAPTNGSTVTTTTPTIVGTTEAGATVVVTEPGGFVVCTAVADASGAWSCAVPSELVEGPHSVIAVATDAAGNRSAPDSTGFVIDLLDPEPPPPEPEPELEGGLSGGALCTVGTSTDPARGPAYLLAAALVLVLVRRRRR